MRFSLGEKENGASPGVAHLHRECAGLLGKARSGEIVGEPPVDEFLNQALE